MFDVFAKILSVLPVICFANLSCSPQYVYFLACVGVADLGNLDAPFAICGLSTKSYVESFL